MVCSEEMYCVQDLYISQGSLLNHEHEFKLNWSHNTGIWRKLEKRKKFKTGNALWEIKCSIYDRKDIYNVL